MTQERVKVRVRAGLGGKVEEEMDLDEVCDLTPRDLRDRVMSRANGRAENRKVLSSLRSILEEDHDMDLSVGTTTRRIENPHRRVGEILDEKELKQAETVEIGVSRLMKGGH